MAGESLSSVLAPFESLFGSLKSVWDRVSGQIEASMKKAKLAAEQAAKAQQEIVSPAQSAAKAMETLAMSIERLIGKLGGQMTALPGEGGKGGAGGAGVGGKGGAGGAGGAGAAGGAGMAAAAGGIAMAAMAGAQAIQSFIERVAGFVDALNPSLMQAFSRSIRDLQATLGVAFVPIFEQLTPVIEQVSSILLPLMEELKPVIDELTNNAIKNMMVQLELLVSVVEALLPLFKLWQSIQEVFNAVMRPVIVALRIFAELLGGLFGLLEVVLTPVIEAFKFFEAIMDGVVDIMRVWLIVFKTAMQTLKQFIASLFGGDNTKIFDQLRDAIKTVIHYMLLFYGSMAKFIDGLFGTNLLGNLINNLQPKQGAKAAIQGVGTKSFEQIAKDMAVASAAASGKGKDKKSQEDLLGDTIKELQAIKNGQQTNKMIDTLNKLTEAAHDIIEWFKHLPSPKQELRRAADAAQYNLTHPGETLTHPIDAARRVLGI